MPRTKNAAPAAPHAGQEPGELLAAAGMRRTPARLALLQVLQQATRALSHADIEALLEGPLDRVTVYRSLDSFVEAGLVQRQVGSDRVSRFALLDGVNHQAHSHFHCDDCGNVFCLPQKPPRLEALPAGFAVEGSLLQFHGHCPDCQQSRGRSRAARQA
jgi:Fur family ferric uptake transcriptional regulator